ncbi:hypothetical protein [Streptomyces odontomachi]|uniref:hypothetical protein n=1 Tax=Streptomyces odontomachi TaxID=2944940 RepID=UPI00210B4AB2|nr:hypothetical protein [Streptomyces sp. ODS25]
MSTALDALYAHMAPPVAPVVSLVEMDRRRAGEDYPTVPVNGMELDLTETAAALFEHYTDEHEGGWPTTDTLYAALTEAVRTLGPAGIAETTQTFAELPADEFFEVAHCHRFAYRLALSFWYRGARCRPMSAGEAAVAVYLSSLQRYRWDDFYALPHHQLLLARALHEGAASVPADVLIRLGKVMAGEQGGVDRDRSKEWLYKQVLPDYHRRRFAFNLVRTAPKNRKQPTPLVVRLDGGGYVLGLTPPPAPDGDYLLPMGVAW